MRFDTELSFAAWVASLIAIPFLPLPAIIIVVATTVNLWHQRQTLYKAGEQFEARVRTTLAGDLEKYTDLFAAMKRDVATIKEAQNVISGKPLHRDIRGL